MPQPKGATPQASAVRHSHGRDHLNLAEHRISVLPRRQPVDDRGKKLDEVTYDSTRYDPVLKRRVPRSVTLTTNSRLGLPTPADENVLLALLCVARQQNAFSDPKVYFTPHELFVLMRWSPNSRSYERFRDVLERLSALRLIYRNAWWDSHTRGFETEFSTGLIASYELTRQRTGRRKAGTLPPSWIVWNPNFFESLQAGSVKRLNLEQVFSLKLPASQQMYRYLDKHFFYTSQVDIDLREFACGHIGLSTAYDTGKLKSRLRPAIAELESIRFIEPAEESARFRKIRPGVWRVRIEKANARLAAVRQPGEQGSGQPLAVALVARGVSASVAHQLVSDHPLDLIQTKLSVFDSLLQSHHPSVSLNPPGFLVQSIRQRYSDPPGYQSAIRAKSAPRPRSATSQRNVQQLPRVDETRRRLERRIDEHLADLDSTERDALEERAVQAADPTLQRIYRRAENPKTRDALRRTIVRRHVGRRLGSQNNSPPEGGELSANDSGRERPRKRPQ